MRLARLGTIGIPLLLLMPACAALDVEGADPDTDGGPGAAIDASGPGTDGGPSPDDFNESPGRAGSCYDRADNDGDDLVDCDDPACATADPVCCVGSVQCCTMAATRTFSVPTDCADSAFADCATLDPQFVAFGAVSPDFESGGLVPQGGAAYGGVALGGAVDPRAGNLRLTATIDVPETRCTDCIDAAGVGFFEALPAAGERGVVRLGVLAVGSRRQVQVMVADRAVATGPLTEGSLTVELLVRADGTASLTGATPMALELDDLELPDALHPVIFGRTDNRAGEPAITVQSATLQVDDCDIPSALDRRDDPVLPASSSTWTPIELGRPAIVDIGTDGTPRPRMVFAHGGSLLTAGINGAGELVGESGPPDALLSPPATYESLHDPWMLVREERVVLFFAAERPDGKREILRAVGPPGRALRFESPEPVELPEDVDSMDGPAVWFDATSDTLRMIARLRDGATTRLVALESGDDGQTFDWAGGELADAVVREPSPMDAFALDRDEVASPALVVVDGTWRLYYAARRGQRWSIGLLVSSEGTAWRDLGAVLEPRGNGFDALSVRDPAPWVTASGDVQLYYVASDGLEDIIALAGPAGTLGE